MSKSKLLAGVLGGAAVGAAIGVLLAPQAGSETRKQILKTARKSNVTVDELIEEGKKTWYETKGKAKMGAGIAADEMDEFMRHILDKGQKLWGKAKNKASEMADDAEGAIDTAMSKAKNKASELANDAENAYDSAMSNGKKSAYNIKDSISQ